MKLSLIPSIAAAACTLCPASPLRAIDFSEVAIEYWAGSGDNQALLIIDWQEDRTLALGYRWEDLAAPSDLEMLEAVNDFSDRLYRQWVDGMPYAAIFGIGWDVDLDGFFKDDPDDWYEEGWLENGYWSQWQSADGESWDWGGGLGTIPLADGSWVGWSWAPDFADTPPDVPLIPAPATLAVLCAAGLLRRRSRG